MHVMISIVIFVHIFAVMATGDMTPTKPARLQISVSNSFTLSAVDLLQIIPSICQ